MVIGGTYVNANDTAPSPSVTPGSKGASQTWDVSALKADFKDTAWGEAPSSLPYYSDFSAFSPNIGLKIDENGANLYGYAIESSTSLTTLGEAIAEGPYHIVEKTNPAPTFDKGKFCVNH